MWLLIAFIAIPLIEIALFIQIGGFLGLWPTLLIVVLTAILGTFLVRQQGMQVLGQLRSQMQDLQDPTEPLAHGAMILFSGALLLTPGFFTDAVGFSLLIPGVRHYVFNTVRARLKHQSFTMGARPQPHQSDVIDGDYTDVTPEPKRTQGKSGWTNDDPGH